MAIPRCRIRLTLCHGVIAEKDEAEVNFTLQAGSDVDTQSLFSAMSVATCHTIMDYWHTFMSLGGGFQWADYSYLKFAKASMIEVSGLVTQLPKIWNEPGTDVRNGTASGVVPQASVCVSLVTDQTVGHRYHGRVYPPHTSYTMSTRWPKGSDTLAESVADGAWTFVSAVNTLISGLQSGSAVRVPGKYDNSGAPSPAVTSVWVGTVVDTQQRRRRQINETKMHSPH